MYKWCVLILFIFFSVPALAGDSFVFTTPDNQDNDRNQALNIILMECFNRLDLDLEIVIRPSIRALEEAHEHLADGTFVRVEGLSQTYPDLLMVPEPLTVTDLVAFSRYTDIQVNGWESLLSYKLAWVRGWQICERHLGQAQKISRFSDEFLLLKFLSHGRADVGIFSLQSGMKALKELNITNVHPLSPPLNETKLYLYINSSHAAIIPSIAKTLKEMKTDGTYQRIMNQFGF